MGRPMRKAVFLAVFAMLVSRVATADIVRHGSIPESYTGTWIASAGAEPDKSVIVLSGKTYVSPEASCSVDWVSQPAGVRGSIYSAHLQCFNPAERAGNKTVANLIIRPENFNRIAVGPEFTSLKIFHRCFAKCQTQRNGLLSEKAGLDESRTRAGIEHRIDGGNECSAPSRPVSVLPLSHIERC
jgi:hypothetical protein